MDLSAKNIFGIVIRTLVTCILIPICIILLIVYTLYGIVIVPSQVTRFIGLTTIASIRSAFSNTDFTNNFIDAHYSFLTKYFQFYGKIWHIIRAMWISVEDRNSQLMDNLRFQYTILSRSWISTVLIFIGIILSTGFSLAMLGSKFPFGSVVFFNQFNSHRYLPEDSITSYPELKLAEANFSKVLSNINAYYTFRMDSLNDIIQELDKRKTDYDSLTESCVQVISATFSFCKNTAFGV